MQNQTFDPSAVLNHMVEAGQEFMRNFVPGGPAAGPAESPMDAVEVLSSAAKEFADMQQNHMQQATQFWGSMFGMPGAAAEASPSTAAPQDRRFAADAWNTDPRFDAVRRCYLTYAGYVTGSIEKADVDE